MGSSFKVSSPACLCGKHHQRSKAAATDDHVGGFDAALAQLDVKHQDGQKPKTNPHKDKLSKPFLAMLLDAQRIMASR